MHNLESTPLQLKPNRARRGTKHALKLLLQCYTAHSYLSIKHAHWEIIIQVSVVEYLAPCSQAPWKPHPVPCYWPPALCAQHGRRHLETTLLRKCVFWLVSERRATKNLPSPWYNRNGWPGVKHQVTEATLSCQPAHWVWIPVSLLSVSSDSHSSWCKILLQIKSVHAGACASVSVCVCMWCEEHNILSIHDKYFEVLCICFFIM